MSTSKWRQLRMMVDVLSEPDAIQQAFNQFLGR